MVAPVCFAQSPANSSSHEIDFPYYSLRDGADSKLLLMNRSPQPLDFTLALHSRSGKTVVSPSMTLQPQDQQTIPIADILGTLAADAAGDYSDGSIAVQFSSALPSPLVGQVLITNPSLGFNLISTMASSDNLPQTLNSVWWGLNAARDAKFMITNVSAGGGPWPMWCWSSEGNGIRSHRSFLRRMK
jgi:hypothetical protein